MPARFGRGGGVSKIAHRYSPSAWLSRSDLTVSIPGCSGLRAKVSGILCTTTFNRTFLMHAIIYCYVVLKFSFCVAFPACNKGFCSGVWRQLHRCPGGRQPVCNHSQTDCQHTTASLNAFCHFSGKSPATTSLFMGFHFKSKMFCLDSVNVNFCWFSQFLVIRSETDYRLTRFHFCLNAPKLLWMRRLTILQTCSSLAAWLHMDAVIRSLFQLLLR